MSTPPTWPPPPPPAQPPPPPVPPTVAGAAPRYVPAPPPPKKSSAIPIVVILIVVVFGGIFVVGIIAAIAIPGLLRARMSGNEAMAISVMRTMVSAQVAWASGHDGRVAQPGCLVEPASCGDTQTPSLLTPEIGGLGPRSGYDFGFVLRPGSDGGAADPGTADGPPSAAAGEAPGVSQPEAPSDAEVRAQLEKFSTPDTGAATATPDASAAPAMAAPTPRPRPAVPSDPGGFAYWASPANLGVTGNRRFCVDETGVVREYRLDDTWTPPSESQPRCPDTGRPLQ